MTVSLSTKDVDMAKVVMNWRCYVSDQLELLLWPFPCCHSEDIVSKIRRVQYSGISLDRSSVNFLIMEHNFPMVSMITWFYCRKNDVSHAQK